jgi:NTP pyrophosphatase (non-canonical NTP hydrolase)
VEFDITTYQALALRTEKLLPTPVDRLEHAALGLFTEGGEIATEIKRIGIYGKTLDDLDKDKKYTVRQHVAEEVADVAWYMAIAADVVGIDFFRYNLPRIEPLRRDDVSEQARLKRATFSLGSEIGRFIDYVEIVRRQRGVGPGIAGNLQMALSCIGQELVNICDAADIDLAAALGANIVKLQERYPEKYSDEAAEARADKGGLDARHS